MGDVTVCTASYDDLDALVALGRGCHDESPHYRRYPLNEARLHAMLAAMLDSRDATILVALREGRIVGALAGMVGAYFFTSAKYATDLVFYVDPAHRRGGTAIHLLRAFEKWAREQGAAEIAPGISSGVAPGRTRDFFELLGYEELGYIMVKYL